MAAVASASFASIAQSTDRKFSIPPSHRCFPSNFTSLKLRSPGASCEFRRRSFRRGVAVHCISSAAVLSDPLTVADTKLNFLKTYMRPIPSIYNTVLQELIVQQHLSRYKKSFRYDPVFALGFDTVYDQLMEGYPSDEDREAIFKAYVEALNEDPAQ